MSSGLVCKECGLSDEGGEWLPSRCYVRKGIHRKCHSQAMIAKRWERRIKSDPHGWFLCEDCEKITRVVCWRTGTARTICDCGSENISTAAELEGIPVVRASQVKGLVAACVK